jgi:hypothetical protein
VRREDDLGVLEQGMVGGQRFGEHDVEPGRPDVPGCEGRIQGVEIDQLPPRRVDHHRPFGQGRQFGRADHIAGFVRQFRRHGKRVALAEHGVQVRAHFRAGDQGEPRVDIGIEGQDPAIEGEAQFLRQFRSDIAKADDADRAAFQFVNLQALAL